MSLARARSHSQDILELIGRHDLTKIPEDQQKLLSVPNSWAVDLHDEPQGPARVPDHVLHTTKEAYLASRDHQKNQNGSDANGSTNGSTRNNQRRNSAAESTQTPKTSPAKAVRSSPPERNTTPSSVEHTELSWSQSPERPPQVPNAPGSSMVCETPAAPLPASRMGPPSVLPSQSSLLLPQAAPVFSLPPPSSDNEEDLETHLPEVQSQPDVPVNMGARLMPPRAHLTISSSLTTNTPPCAQPEQLLPSSRDTEVIPMTEKRQSPVPPSPPHNRRRMKPIRFSSTSPKQARLASAPSSFAGRLPNTTVYASIESSYSSVTSSPVVPSQTEGRSFPIEQLPTREERRLSDVAGAHLNGDEQKGQQKPTVLPEVQTNLLSQRALSNNAQLTDSTLDPYSAFSDAYPDYISKHAGNLWNFVMACVSLQFLQDEMLLVEFLYDDYIRTFSSGYLPYCRKAGPGQEPLSSSEWFNMFVKESKYTQRIVNRKTLSLVLASYPVQVAKARQLVKGDIYEKSSEEGSTDWSSKDNEQRPMRADGTVMASRRSDNGVGEGMTKAYPLLLDGATDLEDPVEDSTPHRKPAQSPHRPKLQPPAGTERRRYFTQPPPQYVPQTGRTVPQSSAASANTPTSRARRSLPYYPYNSPTSSRRSSLGLTPGKDDSRTSRLKEFMKRKRESDIGDNAPSKRRLGSRA